MSVITSQPSNSNIHAAYSSLSYQYDFTVTANQTEPAISVEVYWGGVLVSTEYYNAYDSRTQNGSDWDYVFTFDVSEIAQIQFNNANFFNPSTRPYTSSSLQGSLQVKIREWLPNSDGQLVQQGTTVNSNTIDVLNSRITDLTNYEAATGRKFLTNEKLNTIVISGRKKYLSVWVDGTVVNSARIRTYNSSGTLLATGIVTLTSSDKVYILDVSPQNLDNYTYETQTGTVEEAGTSYYTVEVGNWNDVSFANKSEIRTYRIIEQCEAITLHFQNIFGCQDSYNFTRFIKKYNTRSELYERNSTGTRRLNAEQVVGYELIKESSYQEIFDWLLQISLSVINYIENDSETLEAVLSDGNIEEDEGNILALSFEFSLSLKKYSHIN